MAKKNNTGYTGKAGNANIENGANTTSEKEQKKANISPFFNRAKAAMRIFMNLPQEYQTAHGKRLAVDLALSRDKKNRFPDRDRFWDAGEAEARLLDRAADLKEFCRKERLDYTAVKQHLVLEGKKYIVEIVLDGISGKEARIRKFGESLYDRDKECPVTRITEPGAQLPVAPVEAAPEMKEGANE